MNSENGQTIGMALMLVELPGRQALFACLVTDVSEDQPFYAAFPDRGPIGIFKVGGALFALDDTCTHGQASLCAGFVEDGKIECPYHGALFDIRTGEALTMPATEPVRSYPVEIDGGRVYVVVDTP